MGASCSGPCVLRYVVEIGKIVNELWNSPLRDIIMDLVTQLDAKHNNNNNKTTKATSNILQASTIGADDSNHHHAETPPNFKRCRYARRKPFSIFPN